MAFLAQDTPTATTHTESLAQSRCLPFHLEAPKIHSLSPTPTKAELKTRKLLGKVRVARGSHVHISLESIDSTTALRHLGVIPNPAALYPPEPALTHLPDSPPGHTLRRVRQHAHPRRGHSRRGHQHPRKPSATTSPAAAKPLGRAPCPPNSAASSTVHGRPRRAPPANLQFDSSQHGALVPSSSAQARSPTWCKRRSSFTTHRASAGPTSATSLLPRASSRNHPDLLALHAFIAVLVEFKGITI